MKARFHERFSGCDVAGNAFADFTFGTKRNRSSLRVVAITLFDWGLQRFQFIRVHDSSGLTIVCKSHTVKVRSPGVTAVRRIKGATSAESDLLYSRIYEAPSTNWSDRLCGVLR